MKMRKFDLVKSQQQTKIIPSSSFYSPFLPSLMIILVLLLSTTTPVLSIPLPNPPRYGPVVASEPFVNHPSFGYSQQQEQLENYPFRSSAFYKNPRPSMYGKDFRQDRGRGGAEKIYGRQDLVEDGDFDLYNRADVKEKKFLNDFGDENNYVQHMHGQKHKQKQHSSFDKVEIGDDDWKIGAHYVQHMHGQKHKQKQHSSFDKVEIGDDDWKIGAHYPSKGHKNLRHLAHEKSDVEEKATILNAAPINKYASVQMADIDLTDGKKPKQTVIRVPYPLEELPDKGLNYPTDSTDQYDRADYIAKFHLKSVRYRRFNVLTSSAVGAASAFINGLQGLWRVVTRPDEAVKDLAWAVANPDDTIEAIGHKVAEDTRTKGLSHTLGAVGFDLASLVTPIGIGGAAAATGQKIAKVTQEISTASKAASVAQTAAKAADVAADIGTAAKLARVADVAGDVGTAAKVADLAADVGTAARVADVAGDVGTGARFAEEVGTAAKAADAASDIGSAAAKSSVAVGSSLDDAAKAINVDNMAAVTSRNAEGIAKAGVYADNFGQAVDATGHVAEARDYANLGWQYSQSRKLAAELMENERRLLIGNAQRNAAQAA